MVAMLWAAPARTARADIPGVSFSIDCDIMTPGIQSTCTVPAAASQIIIGYVVSNRSGAPVSFAAAQAEVFNADSSILVPMMPITNSAALVAADWDSGCRTGGMIADTLQGPPGATRSFTMCLSVIGEVLADGSDTAYITQRFALTGKHGAVTLTPYDVVTADDLLNAVTQCPSSTAAPAVPAPVGPCSPATVTVFRCFADVNDDRHVNSTDLLMVAQRQSSVSPYNANFDVTRDGKVNSTDLLSVAKHQGRCTQT
jgi:hypothetical protein